MNPAAISIVIPTSNRKERLLSLLQNLDKQLLHPAEVIIVDSSDQPMEECELESFRNFPLQYLTSEKSVCIQRNTGIRTANSPWILLCDDDIELPPAYLQVLVGYAAGHPEAGAISGRWLEKEKGVWKASHPENSASQLIWKYIFCMGLWGAITTDHSLVRGIKKIYHKKGNHISKAGWPVNIDFEGPVQLFPVHSLGAALVKKEWLLRSPFDEVLDPYGIGDNYGVILGFTVPVVHVLHDTEVYHQQEASNRLKKTLSYYRRVLALDYFIRTRKTPPHVKRRWLLWSVIGHLLRSVLSGNGAMFRANSKLIAGMITNNNPYYRAAKSGKKVTEPML